MARDAIALTSSQRRRLEALVRQRNLPNRIVQRARMILLDGDGVATGEICRRLDSNRQTLGRWRDRFEQAGIDGLLEDLPRSGRPPTITPQLRDAIVNATLHELPPQATHWSLRPMAQRFDVSHASVAQIWHEHGLQPHRVKRFKLSTDPHFARKLRDVVGLYVKPPEHAVVLSVDEKSQIQALDRTQPSLPLRRGRCATMTHDYQRHGTTTLFAALDVAAGKVLHRCLPRHRHQEYLRFLQQIDREVSSDVDLHLIVDNYATHKHPKVERWLAHHPRFHMHFTPTSCSWVNLVERFFSELTTQRLRRAAFDSVPALEADIGTYIAERNEHPRPFVWTAKVGRIINAVRRGHRTLQTLH